MNLQTGFIEQRQGYTEAAEKLADRTARRKRLELFLHELQNSEPLDFFRDEDHLTMAYYMTVHLTCVVHSL